jgi:hypothetical protein
MDRLLLRCFDVQLARMTTMVHEADERKDESTDDDRAYDDTVETATTNGNHATTTSFHRQHIRFRSATTTTSTDW